MGENLAEDDKLVVLARSARVRIGAAEGAAVRDIDGRTYAAASVGLPSLNLSALRVAVAMAVCGGVTGLEAAVVVTEADEVDADSLAAASDLSPGVLVRLVDPDGTVRSTINA